MQQISVDHSASLVTNQGNSLPVLSGVPIVPPLFLRNNIVPGGYSHHLPLLHSAIIPMGERSTHFSIPQWLQNLISKIIDSVPPAPRRGDGDQQLKRGIRFFFDTRNEYRNKRIYPPFLLFTTNLQSKINNLK